ncbi:hypothetical protein [Chrysanthemum yellows phytoplasma]|uniref:hypothetical protein n=1 Tax=Chrysanthemum yellows phytoplasma TaxID=238674 RepID=UPI0006922DDD|nr:hypothetical protein [Chrysanthemum yellows phytoplasma]
MVFLILGLFLFLIIDCILTEMKIIKLPKEGIPILKENKFEKQLNEGQGVNYLILKYKNPKHFLENDKYYCIGRVFVHDANFKLTDFQLHFNPKKTLSIFQDKHKNDKTKKVGTKSVTFKET